MRPLSTARLYLVAPARLRAGHLVDLVPELVDAGVDLVQLREKAMEAGDLLRVGEPLAAACREAGVPFIVNDRPDVALALDADGVHLGTNDLPTSVARGILGHKTVGRSTHSRADISEALGSQDPDYIAVGPVHATPTKPGRPAAGLELVAHAAGHAELAQEVGAEGIPWFAIGGLDRATLPAALEAGARRAVIVRAITEARDPAAAAADLKHLLVLGAGSSPLT